MGRRLFVLGFCIMLMMTFFSGCQENEFKAASFKGITLNSDVVELVNASLDYYYDDFNVIEKIEVKYLFHNIAGKDIKVETTIELYDANNNFTTTLGPKYISLPEDYTEWGYAPGVNIMSYDGENVSSIDHVIIVANEIEE